MAKLQYLVTLKLANNQILSINHLNKENDDESFVRWKNLAHLDLSGNKITEIPDLKIPQLRFLSLRSNEIKRIDKFEGHDTIEILDLSNNNIAETRTLINMPNLKEMFIQNNKLKVFPSLEGLSSLRKLHLRNNTVA